MNKNLGGIKMDETFGATLKRIMKSKNITHAALARAVGVHRTTITDYANDKYLPDEEKFHRIHQVIPDKELYDAFFAATKPKERKNKSLISDSKDKIYNYYKAQVEDTKKASDFVSDILDELKKSEIASDSIDELSTDQEKMLIAHLLVYIISMLEEEGLAVIAPNDYQAYKKLYEKYEQYINKDIFL